MPASILHHEQSNPDLASTIGMMNNILKSSTSRREQRLSSQDEVHSTESIKMMIDEPECDPESKADEH